MLKRQQGLRDLGVLSVVVEGGDGESSAHEEDDCTLAASYFSGTRSTFHSWGDDSESMCGASVFRQDEDDDIRSMTSMPSLSSINNDSVATGLYSAQSSVISSSQSRSGTGSVVSSDFSVSSSLASDNTFRKRSKFLIEIESKVAASTIDCLAPVMPSLNRAKSTDKQMARWGGNGHFRETSPVSVLTAPSRFDPTERRLRGGDEDDQFHSLASRNPDTIPTMPPQPSHYLQKPNGANRSQSAVLSPPKRPERRTPRRNKSFDQVPFVPMRQTSIRNIDC